MRAENRSVGVLTQRLAFACALCYNSLMGKITDIVEQRRNKSRVSVFIDGEFACGLDAVTAAAARIKIGDEITAEELKRISHDSEVNGAFERAVGYLSHAPRAKGEIRKYLRDKGYENDVADSAIERLTAYRYVDDYAYAQSYIKSKSKKYGIIRITAELKRKGISADIIAELTEDGEDDGGITDVALKYLRSHRTADKQKLKRFLAGRGFTWSAISSAVSALAERGAFDGDDGEFADDFYSDD